MLFMDGELIEKELESCVMYCVGKVFSGPGVGDRKSKSLFLFLMQICTFKFQIGLHNLDRNVEPPLLGVF
jgi:hypothetical protein